MEYKHGVNWPTPEEISDLIVQDKVFLEDSEEIVRKNLRIPGLRFEWMTRVRRAAARHALARGCNIVYEQDLHWKDRKRGVATFDYYRRI